MDLDAFGYAISITAGVVSLVTVFYQFLKKDSTKKNKIIGIVSLLLFLVLLFYIYDLYNKKDMPSHNDSIGVTSVGTPKGIETLKDKFVEEIAKKKTSSNDGKGGGTPPTEDDTYLEGSTSGGTDSTGGGSSPENSTGGGTSAANFNNRKILEQRYFGTYNKSTTPSFEFVSPEDAKLKLKLDKYMLDPTGLQLYIHKEGSSLSVMLMDNYTGVLNIFLDKGKYLIDVCDLGTVINSFPIEIGDEYVLNYTYALEKKK